MYLNSEKNGWDDLIARARAIPNLADSLLVLTRIAGTLPAKDKKKALELLGDVKNRTSDIPFLEDRMDHYEILATASSELDKNFSKDCIKRAWEDTISPDLRNFPESRRRLIDFAYRLDPSFASSLAGEVSEDPGRVFARDEIKERIEILDLKKNFSSGDKGIGQEGADNRKCVQMSRLMLEGLNSNRMDSQHLNKLRPFLKVASKMDLNDAYFVLSWFIENSVVRFGDQVQAASMIRPLFDASRLGADLTFRIAARMRDVAESGIYVARNSVMGGVVVKAGDRDLAIRKIKDWAAKAKEFIKITDPYFGLEELEIIKEIRSVNADIPIYVLSSRKHQDDKHVLQPWEETYQAYWRMHIADADPGPVTMIMIALGEGGIILSTIGGVCRRIQAFESGPRSILLAG